MLVVVIREKMEGKTGQRKGASPVSPFQGAPREAREAQVFPPAPLDCATRRNLRKLGKLSGVIFNRKAR